MAEDEGDPSSSSSRFSTILKFCHHSSSQEQLFHHIPFTEHPDLHLPYDSPDSAEIPVDSTGIVMVSLPDSSMEEEDDDTPHEDFRTPPEEALAQLASSEEQKPIVAVDGLSHRDNTDACGSGCCGGDSEGAVDLERDSDFGFSERRVSTCEVKKTGVFESGSEGVISGESPSKKLKFCEDLGLNVSNPSDEFVKKSCGAASGCDGTVDLGKDSDLGFSKENRVDETRAVRNCGMEGNRVLVSENDNSGEPTFKKSKLSVTNLGLQSPNSVNLGGATEVLESEFNDGEGTQRVDSQMLNDSEDAVETDREEEDIDNNGKRFSCAKNPDDIDKYKYVCPAANVSSSPIKGVQVRRKLPLSFRGQAVDWELGSDTSTELWSKTISKFLVMLSKETDDDCLANESILDIAKRRGMIFPQPCWWRSPDGYGPGGQS